MFLASLEFNRQPKFIIPTINERMSNHTGIVGLALESALWCRYCYGTTESGATFADNDPNWASLTLVATQARTRPRIWIELLEFPRISDLRNARQSQKYKSIFHHTYKLIDLFGICALTKNQLVYTVIVQAFPFPCSGHLSVFLLIIYKVSCVASYPFRAALRILPTFCLQIPVISFNSSLVGL